MRSTLKLKGNALMLFALIHGYSKDQVNRCRVSLSYMAEWLDTDKAAISKLINKLSKAGYINKLEYYSGGVKCFEYTANYDAMLAKAKAGESVGLESPSMQEGCQNDNGCQNDKKGLSKRQRRVVKMTTNNNNIIIYNNFSCAEPAQQEEEKKNFYKQFFFRNAADPAEEVRRFVAYNSSRDWKSEGIVYDSPEKRLSLAELWAFKGGEDRCRSEFLKAIENIYDKAVEAGVENADALLDQRMTFVFDGRETVWKLTVGSEARQWMADNIELCKEHIMPIARGWKVKYITC